MRGTCEDCGTERWKIHRHHVIPKSQGGPNDGDNVILLCANCHEDRHGGARTDSLPWQLAQSPAARAKMSIKARANWADPDYRARMVAKRQEHWTPERRAKLAETQKRVLAARSDEEKAAHYAKISANRKGKGSEASSRAKREWWTNATDEQKAQYRAKRRAAAAARRASEQ